VKNKHEVQKEIMFSTVFLHRSILNVSQWPPKIIRSVWWSGVQHILLHFDYCYESCL